MQLTWQVIGVHVPSRRSRQSSAGITHSHFVAPSYLASSAQQIVGLHTGGFEKPYTLRRSNLRKCATWRRWIVCSSCSSPLSPTHGTMVSAAAELVSQLTVCLAKAGVDVVQPLQLSW